jgi:hypothetical protein
VEEIQMKQVQRVVTLALALLLIGLPAVTLAQDKPAADKPAAADKAKDKPTTPSASPSTSGSTDSKSGSAGQASPAMPMSAEDCKNNGWQKFGLKSEAECTAKVKK